MGRHAQGWRIKWRNGWASVIFTHKGQEHTIALGTKDPGAARIAAAKEYAEVISGRKRSLRRRGSTLYNLNELIAKWIESTKGALDEQTRETLVIYGRKYVDFFKELDCITEASIGDYVNARLRQVLRRTMLKERNFLRRFLRWCVAEDILDAVPVFPELPAKASGKRAGKQRAKPVEITPAQAAEILALLPAQSKRIGKRKWPVRERFMFAWEMTFRPETISRLEVPRNWHRGSTSIDLDNEDDKARYGRIVPLSAEALRILNEIAPEEGVIFGKHNFSKRIKRAAKAVLGEALGKRFAPYDFRHGRAQQIVDATGDLAGAAYMLGHTQLSTTAMYLRGSKRAAERALKAVEKAGGISGQFPDTEARHAKKAG